MSGDASAFKAEDMVVCSCGLCQKEEHRRLFSVAKIPIVQCKRCTHVYSLLQPLRPLELYDSEYYKSVCRDHRPVAFVLAPECRQKTEAKTFKRRLVAIEKRFGSKGRLLDVGCGMGGFLVAARDDGWEVEGIEPSEHAARFVREIYQLPVHNGTLDSITLAAQSYDVVTLYDVLEHVRQPKHLLIQVCRLLKPGGLLYLITPNIRSLSARLLGRHWYHLKPLEHLQYFSPDTLRQVLAAASFEVLDIRPSVDDFTVAYILDRLRAYQERLFKALLSLSLLLGGSRFQLALSTGEMEAWARRPKGA